MVFVFEKKNLTRRELVLIRNEDVSAVKYVNI